MRTSIGSHFLPTHPHTHPIVLFAIVARGRWVGGWAVRVRCCRTKCLFSGSHRFKGVQVDERMAMPPFHSPSPLPGHDIIIVKHSFLFRRKRRQALRMSKGNAAIRVTSKPKETTRVNYREADKDMHVNTYFGGFLGAKKRVPTSQGRQGKEMRQIKVRAMTFRRGPAQVTTAFRENEHKRQVGTE
jgi:hypothetical protein